MPFSWLPILLECITLGLSNFFLDFFPGRDVCFEQISLKFGHECTFIAIGDGREQEIAAKQVEPKPKIIIFYL